SLRQRLELEGLSSEQVADIKKTRTLRQTVTVYAPTHPGHENGDEATRPAHLQSLSATVGERVAAGDSLAVLADHSQLYIEGAAFEGDAPQLVKAATENWPLSVLIGGEPKPITDLKLLYSADSIDPENRAAKFYVELPNRLRRAPASQSGPKFVDWQFKPGRRVEILVPVERLTDQLVVPVDAVAKEGAETFVFVEHTDDHGDHFDRVAVHVVMQDGRQAVIAQGGRLKPGDVMVAGGAYQMHLAIKNAAGGGVDPHAGHSH
ncbi:MAG TPA: efflux RND transporter periplasmic adaptor subunit, partial [Pirellulales bacterium]